MTLAIRNPEAVRETTYRRPARLPVDITSSEAELVVSAAVPGADPDSIQITVEDDVLTITDPCIIV